MFEKTLHNLSYNFRKAAARQVMGVSVAISHVSGFIEEAAKKIAPPFSTKNDMRTKMHHEAGHAVLSFILPGNGPAEKFSLIGFGKSQGFIRHPVHDLGDLSKEEFTNIIAMTLGGLVAEEILYGEDNFRAGVLFDLENATEMARNMVVKYGMSPLGLINYESGSRAVNADLPEETKVNIQIEIKKIIDQARAIAKETLTQYWPAVESIANAGYKNKMLSGSEMAALIRSNFPDAQLTEFDVKF
jgi:ATP-dependent Zn protease